MTFLSLLGTQIEVLSVLANHPGLPGGLRKTFSPVRMPEGGDYAEHSMHFFNYMRPKEFSSTELFSKFCCVHCCSYDFIINNNDLKRRKKVMKCGRLALRAIMPMDVGQ